MDDAAQQKPFVVDIESLPPLFPTHLHDAIFWEALGRTIATFGFLEEVLGKAIFAFTATKLYSESAVPAAFEKWLPTLERALIDPLAGLIDAYGKAVRSNPEATITNLDDLLNELRKASVIRNVLCHGSWRPPDASGKSLPLFVNRQKEVWDTSIDILYLEQTQKAVTELVCEVVTTVTHMGWQFPGSRGPGKAIFEQSSGSN
jgi:hypothetical protein